MNKTNLVFFDIDETLFSTTALILVVKNGEIIKKLTNQEFNNYTLGEGEEFDFREFADAKKFAAESKPLMNVIRRLKEYVQEGADVRLLTARADFDCKETFLGKFRSLGIPIDRIHVHRTGNLKIGSTPAEKKAIWVRRYIAANSYRVIKLYDDSKTNLRVFGALADEYPSIKFVPVYVEHGEVK
jgi:hypothetical protein